MNRHNSPTAINTVNSKSGRHYGPWITLAAILFVLVSLLLFPSVVYWDGRFELILRPVYQPGVRVQSITYVAVDNLEIAELIAGNHKFDIEARFLPAERQNDEFVASIRCSGKEIGGIETKYCEPRFLVVRVKYDNDKENRKVVEIPIGRGKRQISIQLP